MRSRTDVEKCGTCEYWTGKRNPVFDKKGRARIDIIDDVGLCENVNSKFLDESRRQERMCCRYSKWTEIL